jgi:hypothetical protein
MYGNLDAFINPLKKAPSPIVRSPVTIPNVPSPVSPVTIPNVPSPVSPVTIPNVPSPVDSVIPSPASPASPASPVTPLPEGVSIHTVAGAGDTMFSISISENTPLVLHIPQCTSISITQTFSGSSDLQLQPTTIYLDVSTNVPQTELVGAALTNSIKWCESEDGILLSYPLEAYLQYLQATDPGIYTLMTDSGFQTIMTLTGEDSQPRPSPQLKLSL